jgi:hypothetical protein
MHNITLYNIFSYVPFFLLPLHFPCIPLFPSFFIAVLCVHLFFQLKIYVSCLSHLNEFRIYIYTCSAIINKKRNKNINIG